MDFSNKQNLLESQLDLSQKNKAISDQHNLAALSMLSDSGNIKMQNFFSQNMMLDSSASLIRRTRSTIPVSVKCEITKLAEENPRVTQGEIAQMFGIDRTTVSKILKRRYEYMYHDGSTTPSKRSRLTSGEYSDIEDGVSEWYAAMLIERQINVSKQLIQQKAISIAKAMGINDFKASDGWVNGFLDRFNTYFQQDSVSSDTSNSNSSPGQMAFDRPFNIPDWNMGTTDGCLPVAARKHTTARRIGKTQRERLLVQGRSPVSATQTSFDLSHDQMLSSPLPTSMPIPNIAKDEVGNGMTLPKLLGQDKSAESGSRMTAHIENRIRSAAEIKMEYTDELNEQEALKRELNNLEKFQHQQKVIEEANKKKKELLAKTITERQKRARAEANKLSHIQRELSHLDTILSADVTIIREKIECVSREYMDAQKRYERIEKMFIASKLDLQRKAEVKDQLTEHLYTVINQNEVRKAQKLGDLMKEMEMEPEDVDLPDVLPLSTFNTFSQLQTLKPRKTIISERAVTENSRVKTSAPIETNSTSVENTTISKSSPVEMTRNESTKDSNSVESNEEKICDSVKMTPDNVVIASVTGSNDKGKSSRTVCENNESSANGVSVLQTECMNTEHTSQPAVFNTGSNCPQEDSTTVDNSSSPVNYAENVSTSTNIDENKLSDDVRNTSSLPSDSVINTSFMQTGCIESRSSPVYTTENSPSTSHIGQSSDSNPAAESTSSSVPSTWMFPFGRIKEEPPS